jgi:acyl carrier protein
LTEKKERKTSMTNQNSLVDSEATRLAFVEILETRGADALAEKPEREAFIAASGDLTLDSLEMDSLALIELVVALETEYEIELSPGAISKLGTLRNLWDQILATSGQQPIS